MESSYIAGMERLYIPNGQKWEKISICGEYNSFVDFHEVNMGGSILVLSCIGVYKLTEVDNKWMPSILGCMNSKSQFYNCSVAIFDGSNVYATDSDRLIHIFDPVTLLWDTY